MARPDLAAGLLGALLVGNCSPASGADFVYRLPPTEPKAESVSRFSLSPDGEKIVLWGRSSDSLFGAPAVDAYSLTLANLRCLRSAGPSDKCWLQRIEIREPSSAVYWQSDGAAFYILTSASHLARVPIGREAVEYAAVDAKFGRNADRVEITAPTRSRNAVQEAERVEAVFAELPGHGKFWIKALTVCRDRPSGVFADRATSRLSLVSDGKVHPLSVYDGWAIPVSAHGTADDGPQLNLGGRLYADWASLESGAGDGATSWRTVVDEDDGCAAGRFSERTVQRLDGSTLLNLPKGVAGAQSVSSIIFWSPDDGDGAVSLVHTDSGATALAGFSANGTIDWLRPLAGEGRLVPTPELLNLGSGTRAVPARLYRTAGAEKLVVAFHGGPTGTAAWGHSDKLALPLLQAGADVLLVDTSGSAGFGPDLAARIAREGPAALDQDGGQILSWLANHHYPKGVGLYGESFGAMGALSLRRAIALRCPSAKVAVALVAPWLVARNPVELGGELGLASINRPYQRVRDERVLGLNYAHEADPFRDWQLRLIREGRWSGVLAVAAETDVVAPPGDARALSGAVVEVVPDAGHLDVFATDGLSARVTRHLLGDTGQLGCGG